MSDIYEPERDAFVAWLNPKFHAGNISQWVYPGRYEKETHQLAWLAWKKRAELALESDSRIAELEKDRDYCEKKWNGALATHENIAALKSRIAELEAALRGALAALNRVNGDERVYANPIDFHDEIHAIHNLLKD